MSKDLVKKFELEQEYRLLIRNMRKREEERKNEKTDDKKADCNQSK